MFNWLHHILEPHCPDCKEEKQENKVCYSCETLKSLLDTANYEKTQLLNALLAARNPTPLAKEEVVIPQAIPPRNLHWNARRQLLEAEDRKKAALLREKEEESKKLRVAADIPRAASGGVAVTLPNTSTEESIANLEKELGIEEGA